MHGLYSNRRGLILYLLVWLFLGVALGGVSVMAAAASWPNALLFALPVTLVYAMAAGYSAYYLCRANPLSSRKPAAILLALGGAALVSGLLWNAIVQGWNELCLLMEVAWAGIAITPQLSALIFGLGVLLYGLLAAVHYLVIESVRARTAERGELESKLMAQEAELRMLRTQIDPHFLFNSLNSISALTSQDPKGAREMTLQLASFFRLSLGMEAHKKVALGEEMQLARYFLAIEKVRFGARLTVEEALQDGAAACLVPPMIIQPLIENAIKHGIAQLPEGGALRVTARRAASTLYILVENAVDTGQASGRSAAAPGLGLGLHNVRQRLACAYRHQASIHWTRSANLFSVEIAMPAETSEE